MIRRIRRPSSSAAALLSQTADGMELGISSVHSRNESSIVAKSFDDEGGSLQLKQFRSQVDGMRSQHDEEAPPAPAPAEAPAAPADWLKRNYRRGSAILAPILNSPLQGQPSVKTLSSAAMLQAFTCCIRYTRYIRYLETMLQAQLEKEHTLHPLHPSHPSHPLHPLHSLHPLHPSHAGATREGAPAGLPLDQSRSSQILGNGTGRAACVAHLYHQQ